MSEEQKPYESIKIQTLPNSEAEIEGVIPLRTVEKLRPRAVKKLSENIELPGFRKGHVPEKVLVDKIDEQTILEEVAQAALADAYPKIVIEHKLDVIGKPNVTITKLAAGNPIGFKIKTALMPEVKLPDYKAIAAKILGEMKDESFEVNEKEVEETLLAIRKNWAQIHKPQENAEKNTVPVLPELNDDFVKGLGDFNDVEDFKTKLKENMKHEKALRGKEKKRVALSNAIIEQSEIALPDILKESELDKMVHQMRGDVERAGLKFEDYLKEIKKTQEDLRKDWEKEAGKRAKLQLALNTIALKENIKPDQEALEREEKQVLEHVKDANPEQVRLYIATVLTNEAVLQFLENQK